VAVRGDLAPGQQLAQSVHAAFEFAVEHPTITEFWHRVSNYLVVVSVPDETALMELAERAAEAGLRHKVVTEPDYGDEVTAIVLEPGTVAGKICSSLPLALRERRCVDDRSE
jgi:peptidyl-tRNA hydrolase